MDKTVKINAYTDTAHSPSSLEQQKRERIAALELEQKQAQLVEERNKSLELLKNMAQLRESLKQEQAKAAEQEAKATQLEAKLNQRIALEESEAAQHKAQIEAEKKHALELMGNIQQLKETIEQEKARAVELADSGIQLEAKMHEISVLQAKIQELHGVISKIASIAETVKMASGK